jgi:uncharacterized protein YPO0396
MSPHDNAAIAADPARTQWRIESMQLVNWGGFHGVTNIEFSPASTLISGASGTGKSTILDAYLALMMGSNTPFNGASNDAGSGRARGATQRSLLTYLRGKLDDIRQDGEAAERTLRGSTSWTWGAVAVSFINDAAQRFTALRLYYIPRSATKDSDLTKKLCTISGTVDLRDFEQLAVGKFDKRSIRSLFPTMNVYDTYDAFAVRVHRRLGIGASGDGASALRLLARIQAGTPITSVDALYKSMVLEEPPTFAAADRAIDHFADLEAAHAEMATAAAKQKVLQELPEHWDDHEAQMAKANVIDELHPGHPDSPIAYWAAVRESELAAEAAATNHAEQRRQEVAYQTAEKQETELKGQVKALEKEIEEAGGGELKSLEAKIQQRRNDRDQAVAARRDFDERTAPLGLSITTGEQFASACTDAEQFLQFGYDDALREIRKARSQVEEQQAYPLRIERSQLRTERESLQGREGQVPQPMHEARVEAAQVAGLQPSDLPFVAELIDVLPDQSEWRTAAELTFSSIARVMLVDERHLDHLSRAIDHLRWRVRINFEGVVLRPFQHQQMDPVMLSGKLAYKDSPFTAWVQDRLSSRGTDAMCVRAAADLNGPGRRVTKTGQTRDGQRGAHGGTHRPIIGFDNKARLADIESRLTQIDAELEKVDAELAKLDAREEALTNLRDAHNAVVMYQWAQIDHETIETQIKALQDQHEAILASSDLLQALEEEKRQSEGRQEEASRNKHRAEDRLNELTSQHESLQQRLTKLRSQLEDLSVRGVAATDEQATILAAHFEEIANGGNYSPEGFAGHLAGVFRRLEKERTDATANAEKAAKALCSMFDRYQERWPDPNLGVGVESCPDYRKILDDITATGLHERRQEWVRRIAAWTGEDLLPLHGAFETAIEDIQDRLAPVNGILRQLPFGATRDRLRIDLRRLNHDKHAKFRSMLKTLSSGATGELTVEHAEVKFAQLRDFIDSIRPTAKGGDKSERDYFLDIRKHIELSAAVVDADGTVTAEYTTLGGKSGGETQELVAFIVGAALRFQLGNETNSRPAFAPVLLDEGFVKADSEFAGRGVNAWKGLGFQLIVAVPFDKVTALEPHVQRILQVTKNPTTGYARIDSLVE